MAKFMTMKKITPILIMAFLLGYTATTAWAINNANKATQTAVNGTTNKNYKFVGDKLPVDIRDGQSSNDKILRKVYSGTKLEILETTKQYSRVRTPKGTEGWILNKYLSTDPVARQKLIEARKQIKELEATIASTEKTFNDLTKTHNVLKQQSEKKDVNLNKLTAENTRIVELAANPIKLSNANKELQQQGDLLKTQIDQLHSEVKTLQDYSNQQWFLKGAGVILSGMLIGVLIPKIRRKQSSKWSNLS